MRKHPVSIALSNRILQKIDQEATKQKRSRSEYVELFFEDAFFTPSNLDRQTLETWANKDLKAQN
jgi:metal-responsive CopG/Arc/MetJ family transcriptional regulator